MYENDWTIISGSGGRRAGMFCCVAVGRFYRDSARNAQDRRGEPLRLPSGRVYPSAHRFKYDGRSIWQRRNDRYGDIGAANREYSHTGGHEVTELMGHTWVQVERRARRIYDVPLYRRFSVRRSDDRVYCELRRLWLFWVRRAVSDQCRSDVYKQEGADAADPCWTRSRWATGMKAPSSIRTTS